MDKQVSAISKSCHFQIRNISRIRPYITESACKTLVCSLVTSRLDYGNALLHGIPSNLTQKLQRIQNTAARLILLKKKTDHITPALETLHWLPVQYRSKYKLLLYVFKALKQVAPLYLQELVTLYRPARTLRSENNMLLVNPSVRTKTYGERRFDKSAAVLWNDLPYELRATETVIAFKKKLKTHLFRQAYS